LTAPTKTLYYYSPAKHLIANLARKRLKVSLIDDLNDPYEILGIYRRSKNLANRLAELRTNVSVSYGFICLSEVEWNPVMWAHYADCHRGVCYRFDVAQDHLWQVDYLKEPKSLTNVRNAQPEDRLRALISTKSNEWRYEREHRLVVKLKSATHEDGLYFESLSNKLVLREVRLGLRCALTLAEIRKVVEEMRLGVQVSKAKMSSTSFRIIEDRSLSDTRRRAMKR